MAFSFPRKPFFFPLNPLIPLPFIKNYPIIPLPFYKNRPIIPLPFYIFKIRMSLGNFCKLSAVDNETDKNMQINIVPLYAISNLYL